MSLIARRFILVLLLVAGSAASAYAQEWERYELKSEGLTVQLPSRPLPKPLAAKPTEGELRDYEATSSGEQFSIFVGVPDAGIYEDTSMNAFMRMYIATIARAGTALKTKETKFLGYPALEYEFKFLRDATPYVARGVTFMIDGGNMRLSMWSPAASTGSEARFLKFTRSLRVVPKIFVPAGTPIVSAEGSSIIPPAGWKRKPGKSAYEVAQASQLTRTLHFRSIKRSAYSCDAFERELKAAGVQVARRQDQVGSNSATVFRVREYLPKYEITLVTEHFCISGKTSVVIVSGEEAEAAYPRWEQVYRGVVASAVVK